jgi:hypothetical protein
VHKSQKNIEELEIETEVKPILFRVWVSRMDTKSEGVIDIEYPLEQGFYRDALEAIVKLDNDGILRLYSRGRGKDIPKEWFPIIESQLLAPVSAGKITPYAEHVFGEGELYKVANLRFHFSESRLRKIKVISPLEHARRQGYQSLRDWPNSYVRRKVFLNHSSKDKRFARKLSEALKAKGVDVWFDEKDIVAGQDFMKEIEEGISSSDFIITVLTPNFIKGPWANKEMKIAIEKEVSKGRIIIIPIIRKDCEIPSFLKMKTRVDFRGQKFVSGLKTLLLAINKLPPRN